MKNRADYSAISQEPAHHSYSDGGVGILIRTLDIALQPWTLGFGLLMLSADYPNASQKSYSPVQATNRRDRSFLLARSPLCCINLMTKPVQPV